MRGRLAASLFLLLAAPAAAHWVTPAEVVAAVESPESRATWGVERAARDEQVPRLLVIQVDGTWYARSVWARHARAADWLAEWREAVPRGIVAVLDATTGQPVVGFGPGGVVTGVVERAPQETSPPRQRPDA